MLGLAALAAASACAGPSAPEPARFARDCAPGPRIGGTAEFGTSDRGLVSEIEGLTISLGGSAFGGTCAGAAYEYGR